MCQYMLSFYAQTRHENIETKTYQKQTLLALECDAISKILYSKFSMPIPFKSRRSNSDYPNHFQRHRLSICDHRPCNTLNY